MSVLSYHPKSQTLRLGAWVIWLLVLVAIHFEFGWALYSAGPPFAILATLALVLYLTSGVTIRIDREHGFVRTRRRLLGIPVWSATRGVALEVVELRAAWMRRSRGTRSVVYDLIAIGRDPELSTTERTVELALAQDMLFFRMAERHARATAKALGLSLVMRWGSVLDGEPDERRESDDLDRSFTAPDALAHWWTWM